MPIYGNPIIKIDGDQTDRVGIRTLTLSQMWQPSSGDLSLPDLDGEEPAAPAVPGGLLLVGRQRKPQAGGFRTYWQFEGVNGNGKDVTFKTRGQSYDYGFDGGMQTVSAIKNPNIGTLLNQFGGQPLPDGTLFWPQFLPSQAASGPRVPDNSNSQQINPLFGFDSYYVIDGTWSYRYVSFTGREAPLDSVGFAVGTSALPGTVPTGIDASGRNWLVCAPRITRRGPVLDIVESYWLSEPGGWRKPIYSKTQGNGSGNNGGAIQASGPIQGSGSL
jgi:hypothetical protein